MWICLNDGFISIVEDRRKKGYFVIRARVKEHLMNFAPGFIKNIKEDPDADYRFRIWMKKERFISILTERINSIDYNNFKNSVEDDELHHAYMDIWHRMYQLQVNKNLLIGDWYE